MATQKSGNVMYICLCNALTDRRLKDAVSQENNRNAADVYAACGCRAKCGQCVRVVKELLRQRDAMAATATSAG